MDIKEKSAQDIAREYLMGEVMAAALCQLRTLDKPWLRLPEKDQKAVIADVEKSVRTAIKKAVEIIVSNDRTYFRAEVESVTFKEGVKAVLTMPNTEASHELADTAGGHVIVVIEDPSRFTHVGENAPKAEKDQPELVK